MEGIAGRTAVVTGAASGIGEAVTRQLLDLDAHVVAVDIDGPALRAAFPDRAVACVEGDLGRGDTDELAAEILSAHGAVSLLVNNVGISTPHDFLATEPSDLDLVMATNLRGPWLFTRRIAQNLVDREQAGAFVFISSLHDRFVSRQPHYSASKAAVSMLVRELAGQLGPHRIRVNAVSPGAVLSAGPRANDEQWDAGLFPLRRAGAPGDVARVVAVLLSEEWCGYVTGANVPVDGGLGLYSWAAG